MTAQLSPADHPRRPPRGVTLMGLVCLLCLVNGCAPAPPPATTASSTASPTPVWTPTPGIPTEPTPSRADAVSVSYDDLQGVFGAHEIEQLASLEVFGSAKGEVRGHFGPGQPTLRREFVRWLFRAYNLYHADESDRLLHPAASGEPPKFTDVGSSDPDFSVIQGLANAGVALASQDPGKTPAFSPDQSVTREQALAILLAFTTLDQVDLKKYGGEQLEKGYKELWAYQDAHQVDPADVPLFASYLGDLDDMVGRAFGKLTKLGPKLPVTHAQAALLLWRLGDRTASDTLQHR